MDLSKQSVADKLSTFLAVVEEDGWWHAISYKQSDSIGLKARAKKVKCRLARFPASGGFTNKREFLDMSKVIETLWEPELL